MKRKPRRDKGFRRNPRTGIFGTDGDRIVEAVRSLSGPRKLVTARDIAEFIHAKYFDIAVSRKSDVGSVKSLQNGVYKIVDGWLIPQGRLVKVKVAGQVSYFLPPFKFERAVKLFGYQTIEINGDVYAPAYA